MQGRWGASPTPPNTGISASHKGTALRPREQEPHRSRKWGPAMTLGEWAAPNPQTPRTALAFPWDWGAHLVSLSRSEKMTSICRSQKARIFLPCQVPRNLVAFPPRSCRKGRGPLGWEMSSGPTQERPPGSAKQSPGHRPGHTSHLGACRVGCRPSGNPPPPLSTPPCSCLPIGGNSSRTGLIT